MRAACGISASSRVACSSVIFAPPFAAWRRRAANSGWSRRSDEPITSALSSIDRFAIDVPSHGVPFAAAVKSV